MIRSRPRRQRADRLSSEVEHALEPIWEELITLNSRLAALTPIWQDEISTPESSSLEATRTAAGFQREIFKIDDSRLASTDVQAGILIAAAVAIVTFTGSLVRNSQVSVPGLAATGASAVLVTMLALYARRERPGSFGASSMKMEQDGIRAGDRVGEMYRLVKNGLLGDPVVAARAEFDAWYALSESIKARRRVKSIWYAIAVVLLLLEVGAAIYTTLSLDPSVR